MTKFENCSLDFFLSPLAVYKNKQHPILLKMILGTVCVKIPPTLKMINIQFTKISIKNVEKFSVANYLNPSQNDTEYVRNATRCALLHNNFKKTINH